MLHTQRLTVGLLLILTVVLKTAAQQPFSLKQSLEYGFENHPTIATSLNDIESAKYRVREGYSAYLPQINGSFSLDDNLKLQTNVIPSGTFGNPQPIEVRFGTKYAAVGNVQLDQKIYDQSLISGFVAYKPSVDLSRMNMGKAKEDIAYNIASSYIKVLVVREQVNLLRTNLASYNKILNVIQLQYNKGVAKKTDFDRIRVTVNNIQSQLTLAEANLQLVENSLKVSMGMDVQTPIVLTDTVEFKQVRSESPVGQFNVQNRMDYKILEKSVYLREVQLKIARSSYVPTISGYARYGAQALNNNFGDMWGKWYDFSSIGLRVNVPIFDGLARNARIKQSKFVWLNEKENLRLYSMQFQMQYDNAAVQVQRSRVSVLTDNENLVLAKEVFEQTTVQYQNGVATLSDLITSENSYKEAQTNYINSLLNLRISELDLQKANGTILNYLNVQ